MLVKVCGFVKGRFRPFFLKTKIKGVATVFRIASIDTGFSAVKVAAPNKKPISVPAVFADFQAAAYVMKDGTKSLDNLALEYEGQRYFVGSAAHVYGVAWQTLAFDYYTSKQGVAGSLCMALHLFERPRYLQLKAVVGLPIQQYGVLREVYQKRLTRRHFLSLLNLDGSIMSNHCVDVLDTTVLPQPVGAFFDAVLGNDGSVQDETIVNARIGIIDVGGHTVDVARIDRMNYVEKASETYADLGCYQVQKRLSAEIFAAFGVEIRPERLMHLVSAEGKLRIRGQEKDITSLRKKAASEVAAVVVSRLKNLWPDSWEMDRIFIAGGGAFLVGDSIIDALDPGRSGQASIVADPVWANVKGFAKVGQRIWGTQA